jgi:hypothetical protein
VQDPADAPNRDLSAPEVRRGVFQCVTEYPEVRAAAEKVVDAIAADHRKKPWWRVW